MSRLVSCFGVQVILIPFECHVVADCHYDQLDLAVGFFQSARTQSRQIWTLQKKHSLRYCAVQASCKVFVDDLLKNVTSVHIYLTIYGAI